MDWWSCSICTFFNESSRDKCEMCETERDQPPQTINDEEYARQLQAQYDRADQQQTPDRHSDDNHNHNHNHNNNHNHNQRQPSIPPDDDKSDQTEIIPNTNSNSLQPRIQSLVLKPEPIQSNVRRSSRLVCKCIFDIIFFFLM